MIRFLRGMSLCVLLLASPAFAEEESKAGGIVMTAVGGALLLTAFAFTVTAIVFWIDGLDLTPGQGSGTSSGDVADIAIASVLTVLAVGCAVVGAILLPKGISRLRGAQPSAMLLPEGGAVVGLRGSF